MMKAVDLRKGKTIIFEGEPSVVHEIAHVAKGNKRSYMQAKIKNLKSGTITETRFRVDDQVEIPFIESKDYEFLYRDADGFVIMDLESFDQITVGEEVVGDAVQWLTPNQKIACQMLEGAIIAFDLAHVVALEVTDTPPGIKGATATNQLKEAILETGAKIRVPPFIETGERVRVDTRTGEYVERAK